MKTRRRKFLVFQRTSLLTIWEFARCSFPRCCCFFFLDEFEEESELCFFLSEGGFAIWRMNLRGWSVYMMSQSIVYGDYVSCLEMISRNIFFNCTNFDCIFFLNLHFRKKKFVLFYFCSWSGRAAALLKRWAEFCMLMSLIYVGFRRQQVPVDTSQDSERFSSSWLAGRVVT